MSGNSKLKPELRGAIKDFREAVAIDNAAKKSQRNSRRWKAERDPTKYEKQKAIQREEYAAKIKAEEGREVRAHCKVPGETKAEREENARARDAARKRVERKNAPQEKKDQRADKVWAARKRKAGWSDEQIAQGLAKRAEDRLYRQPDPGPYKDNPKFGMF